MVDSLILRLAIPTPLYSVFDYLPPRDCNPGVLEPGMRLWVPFGRGERCGVLLEVADSSRLERARLKRALGLIDESVLLARDDLFMLKWAADYYQHPLGEVIFNALPSRLRKGQRSLEQGRPGWCLTSAGRRIDPGGITRAPRQAAVMKLLKGKRGGVAQEEIYRTVGVCHPVLRRLEERGWVEARQLEGVSGARSATVLAPVNAPTLNADQQAAVDGVTAAFDRFDVFLLDGVTGSGKTEVYIRLLEKVIARGRQALLLVPEIGLTPQLLDRLGRRLAVPTVVMHSGLSERDRESAWQRSRAGQAGVLLGTRSAVFTPLPNLGLILVDEEHDLSFKQQDGFRYSARDLAVIRGKRAGCPVVLGSATPSLESLRNAELGRYRVFHLPERAGAAVPPRFDLLDIRSVKLEAGVSQTMMRLVRETLEEGNQALLFLNRRGFAPVLTCHDCGWMAECGSCDARMTYHLVGALLWCHHCGSRQKVYARCPECGSVELRALGQGTERLQQSLAQRFPDVGVARIDRDSTRRKGALEGILKEVGTGAYSLLIGTQMLAKGHHFPDVTLVGILDLDQGLFGADYRAAERMAQLIIQVAGRAGRAEKRGRVVLQTRHPDHPLLQDLLRNGYAAFAAKLMSERSAAGLPPFSYQALLRAEANGEAPPMIFLEEAKAMAEALAVDHVELWGPVPAPMERRAGRYRAHLLLQAGRRSNLHRLLSGWVSRLQSLRSSRKVRWSIDVDPQELH